MELLFAATIGILVSTGVYLMLRGRTFPVVLGLALISYAVNFFVFVMGRPSCSRAMWVASTAQRLPAK